MKNNNELVCPVSAERVNENGVRTVAVLSLVLVLLSLYLNNFVISGFLALDFILRAFFNGKASALKALAKGFVRYAGLGNEPVDAAPKKFAASLGLVFALLISGFQAAGFFTGAYIAGGMLIFCAFLEGAFGYCLGCVVYTFLRKDSVRNFFGNHFNINEL